MNSNPKNIVITGASRGIGYATAIHFATNLEKPTLFVLARSKEKLENLQKEIQSINPNAKVYPLTVDLMDFSKSDLAPIYQTTESIDILLNNAGYLVHRPFGKIIKEEWMNSFHVNFFGPMKLIRHLSPLMGKSTTGHIVNITTMGAVQGSVKFPGLTAYSTSKAALANLTELLAEEFKKKNIAVNALALGAVQTQMQQEAFPNYKAPLTANEMAAYISHFCLTAHKFMNGKIVPVSISTP
jgi:short-subunit dehydrogenase